MVAGATVTPDGSGSSDADGDLITWGWSFVSRPAGSVASLTNPTSVSPSFTADVDDDYVVELVVNDGSVDSAPDRVTVSASLTNVATSTPSFTPDVDGDYVAELVVNDGNSDSQPDHVVITAVPAGSDTSPPTVEQVEVLNSPIDVSSGSARARIRVRLRDDISGVTGDILGLRSPSGSQSESAFIDPAGSPNTFEAVLVTGEFSVSAETGTWTVDALILSDEAGNTTIVGADELEGRGFVLELEVTN